MEPVSSPESSKPGKTIRKKFTESEDKLLQILAHIYGSKNWNAISIHMPGRTARQCRDRYCNYLMPGLFAGEWTVEEDNLIREKYAIYGPQWSKISHFFVGRSPNSIKNRWKYYASNEKSDELSPVQIKEQQPVITAQFQEVQIIQNMDSFEDFSIINDMDFWDYDMTTMDNTFDFNSL